MSLEPFSVNTSLIYLYKVRIRTQIIYTIVLLAVLATICTLPFVYTSVSVRGKGIMQSTLEKTELLAPVSGRLIMSNLKDNQRVLKGSTLLMIDAGLNNQQHDLLINHKTQLEELFKDTQSLLALDSLAKPTSGLYSANLQQYLEQKRNAMNAKNQAHRIFKRYERLYDQKALTQAEYDERKYNFQQAQSDLDLVAKKYKAQWQADADQYRNSLRDIQNQNAQLNEQQKQYKLVATVSGSLQNLTGIQPGSFIYVNQKMGEISPDSSVIAVCYIKTSDIGLISARQDVRFQIDAFNYNQWGVVDGKVQDISDDVIIQEQIPYFKVKCSINKNYLQLKNGYKGSIKKGMTFSARFIVTKRSLYQLLYDNIDDWLNPRNTPGKS